MSNNDFVYKDEVALLLGVHPVTVTKMAKRGEIPGLIIGNKWCFNRDQINEWIRDKMKENVRC